jgi:hypothetical protein
MGVGSCGPLRRRGPLPLGWYTARERCRSRGKAGNGVNVGEELWDGRAHEEVSTQAAPGLVFGLVGGVGVNMEDNVTGAVF